jgi:zinc transporter ZupT
LDPKSITPVLLSIAVAWGMYRRVRRNIGRQPVNTPRLQLRIGIFLAIGALVLFFSWRDLNLLAALVGGFACGAALAYSGLRHTRFEATVQGRFYTPHTYIGLIVSALFLSRIMFRLLTAHAGTDVAASPGQNPFGAYQKSPLTLGIFGVLVGYYVFFNIGILRRSRSLASQQT